MRRGGEIDVSCGRECFLCRGHRLSREAVHMKLRDSVSDMAETMELTGEALSEGL